MPCGAQLLVNIGFPAPFLVVERMIQMHFHRFRRHGLFAIVPCFSCKIVLKEGVFRAGDRRTGVHLQHHLVAAVPVHGSRRNQIQIALVAGMVGDKLLPVFDGDKVIRFAAFPLPFL